MKCPNCNAENADGTQFCRTCGIRIHGAERPKRSILGVVIVLAMAAIALTYLRSSTTISQYSPFSMLLASLQAS